MEQGKLIKWNDEKGFGFVRPDNSNEEIFFHISALQKSVRRPLLGDAVYFSVGSDDKGRRRAVDVGIQGAKAVFSERPFDGLPAKHSKKAPLKNRSYRSKPYSNRKRSFPVISLLVLLVFGAFVFDKFNQGNLRSTLSSGVVEPDAQALSAQPVETSAKFTCVGKTRCTQMTSCEEAKFYLNHCPGSVTDGDGDGRPCEDQWCGH